MGSQSVTGQGHGSAEGPLRQYANMDWISKVFGINASQIANGIISNIEFEYLHGLTSPVQEQINDIKASIIPSNEVQVGPDFTYKSIAAACASIVNPCETNRWVVRVSPGIYTEPEINIPSYVYVQGENQDAVVVKPDALTHHVFSLNNKTSISNLTIKGAGTGYAGVYSNNIGNFAILHKVSISNCDIGIWATSSTEDSYLFTEFVDFTDCATNSIKVVQENTKFSVVHCENTYSENYINFGDNILVDGGGLTIHSATFVGPFGGNCVKLVNGGAALINATSIQMFDKAIYTPEDGGTPNLIVNSTDFQLCNTNLEITSSLTTGNFTGYSEATKNNINPDNAFFITNKDSKIITVAEFGGDFTSIKAAIESINDSGYDNRYTIAIGPGVFVEDPMTLRDYVSITGEESRSTIIELNPAAPAGSNLFTNPSTVNVSIRKVLLRNATGAAYKYHGGACRLEQVRFGDNNIAVDASGVSGTVQNTLDCQMCSMARSSDIPLLFKISDDGTHPLSVIISHFDSNDSADHIKKIAEIGMGTGGERGINTHIEFVGCSFAGDGTDTAIAFADGADVHILATQIMDFDTGLYCPNTGDGPEIEAVGSLVYDNATYDILIQNPLCGGVLQIESTRDKVVIDADANISTLILGDTDGSLSLGGDFYQGSSFSAKTNMTDSLEKNLTLGVTQGGGITIVSGRIVSVAAGAGYLMTGSTYPDNKAKFITWNTQQVTIPANSNKSIYIDSNGILQTSDGTTNIYTSIFLARIVTDASNIILLADSLRDGIIAGTKYDRLFRQYLGAIYQTGSISSAVNTTQLKVTAGNYAFSTRTFAPSGANPITFTSLYPDGTWFGITSGLQNVPFQWYDQTANAGDGGLVTITDGKWAKHALYVFGEGANEKYYLVYGQAEFSSLLDAENGSVPPTPSILSIHGVLIASVIVQKADATALPDPIIDHIAEVIDLRPTLVTRVGSVTSASVHGNLDGLDADDHKQYLLVNGNRAMSGNLDMGTNDIDNVGTVDGVTISSHVARHLPNGSDPLPTDAPNANLTTTTTNNEGIQNKFSRSDHTHAITTASANAASTIVARNASGNFSANMITANLTGDVTGNVSGSSASFTGNLVGQVTGTQGSTVVSFVGTTSKADVEQSVVDTKGATDANTGSKIVKRDISGNFTAGTITATLNGTATAFSGSLVGQVTGTQGATVVAHVGSTTAADVEQSVVDTKAATELNTVSKIVKRDGSGDFAARIITATLNGAANSFSGNLAGQVTGTQGATVVAHVGTTTAADVEQSVVDTKAATDSNTVSKIVKRDGSGDFSAGTITATLNGTATNVSGTVTIAHGGTNSTTALQNNRIMVSSGSAIVETSAITGNRAIVSNSSGLPIASTTTDTEIGYVSGVTSAIQTQLGNKAASSDLTAHTGNTSNPHTTTLEQARTAGSSISGNINANGYTIINLPDPVNPTDACNRRYADAIASGLNVKDPVVAATTTNLTANYSALNLTLTSTTKVALVIDTVSVSSVAPDRVLVKDQTTKTQNGIYVVTNAGEVGVSEWVLTRSSDFNTSAEVKNGSFTLVTGGDVNKNAGYVLTSLPPITLDSSDLIWSKFSQTSDIQPGTGLALNGTAFDVQVDGTTIDISSNELIVKSGGIGNTQLDKANISLSGFGVPTGDISFNSHKITNLAAPSSNNDAARKTDVDTVQGNLTAHIGTGGTSHAQVTTSVDGFMIAADKLKLNSATATNTTSTIVLRNSSGDFAANMITANLTGDVTGNASGSAASFTGNLAGQVTGPQGTTVVAYVGTTTAADVEQSVVDTKAAIDTNTASTIVKRSAAGNFSAGTITATLSGSATSFSGNLVGQVTGTQGATVVSKVGATTAADVEQSVVDTKAATDANTNSTIVKRSAAGNFSAGTITATLSGSATSFSGNLVGQVTGTQGATVVSAVGATSASDVETSVTATKNAVSTNTASRIVLRDGSGNFAAGTITANLTGNVTGALTGNASGSAATFTTALTGDVTGGANGGTTTVALVGGSTAALVHSAELAANAATTLNTPSTIVKRDASGNFTAGTITANLTGNVTGNITGTSSGNVPYTGATADVNLGSFSLTTTNINVANNYITPEVALTVANGNNNNLTLPNGYFFKITGPTNNFTITGITGGVDGRNIVLWNSTANNMTVTNEGGGSTAANRILTNTGGSIVSSGTNAMTFIYSGTAARWIHVSNTL